MKTEDSKERVLTSAGSVQFTPNTTATWWQILRPLARLPLPMVDTHPSRSLRYETGLTSHYDITASVPCLGLTSDQAPCLKCVK